MRVVDYIAQKLAQEGIDTVFLVQGAANNDLIYAIADRDDISYICPMHEQAAGFMAEGYAKVRGVPGVAIATSGPGGQNLLTPICNFYYDSIPGLFITGQVNSQFMRIDDEIRQVGFQEWPASDVFKHVTKFSQLVRSPRLIRYILERALHICKSGRPGPVHLDIPIDVQRAEIGNPDDLVGFEPDTRMLGEGILVDKISQLIADLKRAKRPVIVAGGGIRGEVARRELAELAFHTGIPVFPTWNALDVVTSDMECYGGRIGTYAGPGRNFAVQNSDLLLAIGCRLSGRITGGNIKSFARAARRYVVDVDEALLQPHLQQLPFHVSIRADATDFMWRLKSAWVNENRERTTPDYSTWMNQVRLWRDKYDPVRPEFASQFPIHPYVFARELSEVAARDAIIVSDCGGNVVVMNHAFKTKSGQRYLTNNGNSPMGFSFAGALGAWYGGDGRQIICVIGDGGMNMNIQELQTMFMQGINIKVFILNNRVYGITKQFQQNHYGDRFEASCAPHYVPPNFCDVVAAYNLPTRRLTRQVTVDQGGTVEVLRYALRDILSRPHAFIVDVDVEGHCEYAPRIAGWATPIEDMTPLLPRDEFRSNMLIDPLPGWETGNYGPYHGT